MSEPPYLVVPGWGDSGPAHWQSLWETTLGAERVHDAPWLTADPWAWEQALDRALRRLAERDPRPPVVLAHSLGCIVFARWAKTARLPVRAAFLVAPADVDQPSRVATLSSFAPAPRHRLPCPSLVIASTNDPYITLQGAAELATSWGSELEVVALGGHLNAESGHGAWRHGREMLERLVRHSEGASPVRSRGK